MMGRPVKDYWNWEKCSIPYAGDWRRQLEAEHFLRDNVSNSHYKIFASSDYPTPRRRHSCKVYTAFHYYIKDPKLAIYFALRYAK
jgi:hypothetical protein